VLVVWGAHDGVIPVEHARLAVEAMPWAQMEIFTDAGHFPHHSDPDRFVATLEEFIADTDPAVHLPHERRSALARRAV
jgi:pimeloyl-ACP methyl ester carboxylesterase